MSEDGELSFEEWQALANALDVALTQPDSGDALTEAVVRIVAAREAAAYAAGEKAGSEQVGASAGVGPVIARIVVTRYLTDDDILDDVAATTSDGTDLDLSEALGLMRLAEDTLIRKRMGEDG